MPQTENQEPKIKNKYIPIIELDMWSEVHRSC